MGHPFFDSFKWTDPRAQQLRKVLATTYTSVASSTQILSEAGVDVTRIDLEQSSTTRWFFAIDEADKSGLLRDLVELIFNSLGPKSKHASFLRARRSSATGVNSSRCTTRADARSRCSGDRR